MRHVRWALIDSWQLKIKTDSKQSVIGGPIDRSGINGFSEGWFMVR